MVVAAISCISHFFSAEQYALNWCENSYTVYYDYDLYSLQIKLKKNEIGRIFSVEIKLSENTVWQTYKLHVKFAEQKLFRKNRFTQKMSKSEAEQQKKMS